MVSCKEQLRQETTRNEAMAQRETEIQVTHSILPTAGQTRCSPCKGRLAASEAECARLRQLNDTQRASDQHGYEAELASERRRYQKLEVGPIPVGVHTHGSTNATDMLRQQRHRLKLATLVQHFEADRRHVSAPFVFGAK